MRVAARTQAIGAHERDEPAPEAARASRAGFGVVASLLSYRVALLPFPLPWLRAATHAVPSGALLIDPTDGPLIGWALGWVASVLGSAPATPFDAPVNHPEPAQLAGTEHFLSSQIVFLPTYLVSGNALLAANVVAVISYPIAALAMQRLLLALGCTAAVAWVGGLVFALKPMRVLGNLQIPQYENLPAARGAAAPPALYRPLVDDALARLPAPEALARPVDLTHVRWLLLRPEAEWAEPRVRAGLFMLDGVGVVAERGGLTLARIDRTPAHDDWYRTVATGGSPVLAPLDDGSG
jgi:hypothetical protein